MFQIKSNMSYCFVLFIVYHTFIKAIKKET